MLLEQHEAKHPSEKGENPLQRASKFWGDFESEAQKEFGLGRDLLQGALTRLARSGMYQEITGAFTDYGGGRGYLTPMFAEFMKTLGISSSECQTILTAKECTTELGAEK